VDARGWAGRTPGEVSGFLGTLPLLHGIEEVLAWCFRTWRTGSPPE
jgi:phosphoserine phosphatase